MSPEMDAAVKAFDVERPLGCTIHPQRTKPIYTLVTIEGWPRAVHYEFRSRQEGRELYVEIHIEHPAYLSVAPVLKSIVRELPSIHGFALEYFESRSSPHRKKWPSVSIALPPRVDGHIAASVMKQLIFMTKATLDRTLSNSYLG